MPADELDLEILRALRGPDAPPPGEARERAAARLFAAIDAERGPARPRRGRGPIRLAAVLVVVGLAGAGYAVFKPADPAAGVICATDVAETPSGLQAPLERGGPTATCAALWRRGLVDPRRRRAPAQLTACDSGGGAVFVFPAGGDVCARVGMQPAADRTTGEERRFIAMRKRLVRWFMRQGDGYVSFARGEAQVRRELRRSRLVGWEIRRGRPASPGARPRPCASLYFQWGSVTLVPMERHRGP